MKMRPWGFIAAAAVAVSASLGVWVLASSSSHSMSGMSGDASSMTGTSTGEHSMASGSKAEMTEAQFITEMIPHHEQAVEMAQLALERASRPEVKTLARNILSAQEAEISQMQTWNRSWFGGEPASAGGNETMGMAGEIEMLKTSNDFDRDFLTAMIPHHRSAIEMANRLLRGAPRRELKMLAQAIIAGQQQEIDQMQGWRKAWNS